MNEFLKNLRSGKDNRQHSGSRNFSDGHFYPQQDRRSGGDRRREPRGGSRNSNNNSSDQLITTITELMPHLHDLIERAVENQTRIAVTYERMLEIEERKLQLLESCVDPLNHFLEAGFVPAPQIHVVPTSAPTATATVAESPQMTRLEELDTTYTENPAREREIIIQMIKKMRKKGATYDQIARHLEKENIATFSGKGKWHAQTIHRLCKS